MSVVQPPAQSRVDTEFRPGVSGPYPVATWKTPRTETLQCPWTICDVGNWKL